MAEHSTIEWTDATWNPVTGCSVVSPGCTICYAMKLAGTRLKNHPSRKGLTIDTKAGPVWNGKVRLNEQWLDQPLRWTRPRMIFVCAHGDLFHEDVPDEWIDRVFAVMAVTPWHTYQVLTKRAARMRSYFAETWQRPARAETQICDGLTIPAQPAGIDDRWHQIESAIDALTIPDHERFWTPEGSLVGRPAWPRQALPNVWLGVSAEDQTRADERIPDLLATPAAARFLSAEPLLGPIDLTRITHRDPSKFAWLSYPPRLNALTGNYPLLEDALDPHPDRLDWVIAGGESGAGARPMHPDWVRSLRDQCAAADTAFFFKQWGNWSALSQMSEEQIDACYPPLNERHPDATRHALVDSHVLHADGSRHRIVDRDAFLQGTGAMTMFEVGKKRAGRRLDGVEHNGMPQPREVPAL